MDAEFRMRKNVGYPKARCGWARQTPPKRVFRGPCLCLRANRSPLLVPMSAPARLLSPSLLGRTMEASTTAMTQSAQREKDGCTPPRACAEEAWERQLMGKFITLGCGLGDSLFGVKSSRLMNWYGIEPSRIHVMW